jgi:hypothetical protein
MSLSDWEVYKSSGSLGVAIDTATPLVGSGSLQMVLSLSTGRCNLRLSSAHSRGFLKGKVRTLLQPNSAGTTLKMGLYCMASQADITTDGSFYRLMWYNGAVRLDKPTSGIDHSPTELTSSAYSLSAGQTIALELEWAYDLAEWGGTRLVGRVGSATDFSDLAEVIAYTDTSTPLSTSVGEGLFSYTTSGAKTVLGDETTIFELL